MSTLHTHEATVSSPRETAVQDRLDDFARRSTIDGNHLTFSTKPVHDIWYSFDGSIVRSDVPAKQETGFYRLKGSWVMHADSGKTQSTSMVSFKSTPRSE